VAEGAEVWWRRGVVYEIYPRSFQDSDGDGVGDLAGIEQRLDHLVELGVDALWIAPFFPSPMKDFGYDVADYCAIDPLFGTMAEFDRLLDAAHARGLKVITDFVLNHTSDQHPWFLESSSSRTNPKRDWYVWTDPAPGGGPPNNWLSIFGGPSWRFDGATGQYFLHSFLSCQPDLNWRNQEVERAMFDVIRFWLDKGVDGFRLDALWMIIKDDQLRDNPPDPDWRPGMIPYLRNKPVFSGDRPEAIEVCRRMRVLADSYPGDRVLIGETYLPVSRLMAYYGERGDGLHLPFNFKLIQTRWDARELDEIIRRYHGSLPEGAWPNWVAGNHDNPRVASRIGGREAARAAAVLLLTLRGTPTIYYGEELGLEDIKVPPGREQDPRNFTEPGFGRDGERAPMPWSDGTGAGFTPGEPWLPLPANWVSDNVGAQAKDSDSMLGLYRRLLVLRRAEPALHAGEFAPLGVQGDALGYVREGVDGARFLVAVNVSAHPQGFVMPAGAAGTIVQATRLAREGQTVGAQLTLEPNEAVVIALS
jgi:alpha-glucosidase